MPTPTQPDRIRPADYCSVATAAAIGGCHRSHVHNLLHAGDMRGVWVDGQWFVLTASARRWQRRGVGGHQPTQGRRRGDPLPQPPGLARWTQPATIRPADWVTINTAAATIGCSPQYLRQVIRRGAIPGVWIDRQWLALASAVLGYTLVPGRGRPRKGPPPVRRSRPRPQPRSQPTATAGDGSGRRRSRLDRAG
jgi:hypothetical protein